MVSKVFVDEVRQQCDLVEVASQFVSLKRQGKNLVGLCPFHEERTPSFTIAPDKQLYYCFGCQAGGDVFNFVMDIEGLTFPEALRYLAERAGLSMPESVDSGPSEQESQRDRVKRYLYRLAEFAAQYFGEQLDGADGARAREYLEKRGISPEIHQKYRLGYAPDGWQNLCTKLRRHNVSLRAAELLGLIKRSQKKGNYYDVFRDRIMFPISDLSGRVIAFGGRVLGDDEPKYLNSAENLLFSKGKVWYGLNLAREQIRRRDRAIIVEGYMDVLACASAGWEEAVATMGTAMTEYQGRILARYTRNALIAFDSDAAGATAVMRSMKNFYGTGVQLRVMEFPEGQDPDDVLNAPGGSERFEALADEAKSFFEFSWELAQNRYDVTESEGKANVIRDLAVAITHEEDPVIRADRIRFLAERLRLPEDAVRAHLRHTRQQEHSLSAREKGSSDKRGKRQRSTPPTGRYRAEQFVIRLMLQDPRYLELARERLTTEDFSDTVHQLVAQVLLHAPLEEWSDVQVKALNECRTEEERKRVARLMIEEVPPGDVERIFSDSVEFLLKRAKEKRLERLQLQVAEKERAGEVIPPELLAEQASLLKELQGYGGCPKK